MNKHTMTRAASLATTVILALVVAGCGSSENVPESADHNSQDITFANGMIPHHGQAVAMAKLAPSRAFSPEVRSLATKIEQAQQPEIDTMNSWLKSWGEPTVDPSATKGHSKHAESGMLSAGEMSTLASATGTSFDRLFLQGMIKHHEGAIAMAKIEQEKGKFEAAKAMAGSIISSQQTEIDEMKVLLSGR